MDILKKYEILLKRLSESFVIFYKSIMGEFKDKIDLLVNNTEGATDDTEEATVTHFLIEIEEPFKKCLDACLSACEKKVLAIELNSFSAVSFSSVFHPGDRCKLNFNLDAANSVKYLLNSFYIIFCYKLLSLNLDSLLKEKE